MYTAQKILYTFIFEWRNNDNNDDFLLLIKNIRVVLE